MPSKLKSLFSVLFTLCIYSLLIGWKVGLLIVVAISFHEQCHLLAAKKLGLKTNNFIMIPFIGGVSFIAERYKSYSQQAFVVLAGPLVGCTLAMVPFVAWLMTGIPFLLSAAYWILIINALNLMPLGFLDGGQIMDTITYSFNESLGFYCRSVSAMVAIVVLYFLNPILAIFVGFFGMSSILSEYNYRKFMKLGYTWMCPDWYLNRPERMNNKQMISTVIIWTGSVAIMDALIYLLSLHTVSITNYFVK